MKAVIDDIVLVRSVIELGSIKRRFVEKFAPGVNGSVSIDMGLGQRTLKHKGVLRGESSNRIENIKSRLNALIDGRSHILTTEQGDIYERLRVDSLFFGPTKQSANFTECSFEINYTQLRV